MEKQTTKYSEGFDPPPPKWVYQPVPDFSKMDNPKLEEDKYWEEENRRWLEGHAGLCGMHYFYLQQCFLNDNDGNVFRPRWRDCDELMFTWAQECLDSGHSLFVIKRREIGATSVYANLPFWFMRVFPGCRIGLTSGKGNDGINGMFNDKVVFSYNRFNPKVLNTTPVQINNTKALTALEVALKVYNEGLHEDEVRTSILFCKETSEKPDSPTNLSGRRYKYVFVDEAPLHSRIEDFLGSIFPALNQGPRRTGLLIMAGTVEPKLTSEMVAKFFDLINRSKNLNVRTEILPVWLGLITKNGWSDEKAGMEWYWENYNKFDLSGDLKGLRDFRMQYPKDEEDIKDLSQGGYFEPDVADILSVTYGKLLKQNSEELPYKLINANGVVEAFPDTKARKMDKDGNMVDGGHWIITQPKENTTYYQAIDSIGVGKKEGAEQGSWIASTIYGFNPHDCEYMPVAHYFERPDTLEQGYRNIVNQWRFYNKYGGGKEINYETAVGTSDHFATYLNKEGLYNFIYKQKDLSGKGNADTHKRGTRVNDHTREWQVRQANVFLRMYGYNIKSRLLLHSLLKSSEDNADIRDAFLVFMVSIPNFDKPVVKKAAAREITKVRVVRKPDGSFRHEMYKETIMSPGDMIYANQTPESELQQYKESLIKRYGQYYWYNSASGEEKEKYRKLKGTYP